MSSTSHRKLKNFVISPNFQFKLVGYFSVALFAAYGLMLIFVYLQFSSVINVMANAKKGYFEVAGTVDSIFTSTLWQITAGFLVLGLVSFLFAIVVSHRIAGPSLAIIASIKQLKNGNYSHRRTLRPYDDLQGIMNELNELAAELEKKVPS